MGGSNRAAHIGLVGQSFLDGDLWSAECSCGWIKTEMVPYDDAVRAANRHADEANGRTEP